MQVKSRIQRLEEHPLLLVGSITLLAGSLRLYGLAHQPLWLDEALTRLFSDPSYRSFGDDVHPPLYYWLTRLWMHGLPSLGVPSPVNDTEWFLRLPSVFLGTATVALVFAIGRSLSTVRLGLAAALLMALSPFQVRFAQEARMYTLLTFLAAVALWGLSRLLLTPSIGPRGEGAPTNPSGNADRLAWPAVVVGLVGTLYTHNTGFLLLLSCNLIVGMCLVTGTLPARDFLKRWTLVMGLVLLGWAAWLPHLVSQAQGVLAGYWIPSPEFGQVLQALSDLYLPADRPLLLYLGCTAATLWLLWLGILQARKSPARLGLLLIPLFLPVIALLLISLVQPVFLTRTLIWTSIPLYLILASGLFHFKRRLPVVLLCTVLLSASGWGLAHYYTSFRKEAWDQAAAFVGNGSRQGDIILIHRNYVKEPFNYYFRRYGKDIPQHPLRGDLAAIRDQMASLPLPRRVWLVASHVPMPELLELLRILQEMGAVFQEEKTLTGVNVLLFGIASEPRKPPAGAP